MDKFLVKTGDRGPPTGRKRILDDPSTPICSEKKSRPSDEALLQSNYFSPLLNDNGETPAAGNLRRKEPFIPAIILHQELTNPKSTFDKIKSWAKNPVYFKQRGAVRHIHATHKDDFVNIKAQLSTINFKWTSHKAEDDIPKKLILKGIDKSYTEDEVLEDIKKQFNTVQKVKQLTKTGEDGKQISLGVYLVYFQWSTRLSIPMKVIKYVCHHKIKWDYFHSQRKQNKVKQCYKCQWFDHHSSECGMDSRCVKCDDKHSPGKCTKVKGVNDPVCCNCGGSHPASYQGCPKIKEHAKNKAKLVIAKKMPTNKLNGIALNPKTPQAKRKLSFNSVVKASLNPISEGSQFVGSTRGTSGLGRSSRGPAKVSVNVDSCPGGGSSQGGFSFIMGEINSLFGITYDRLMGIINDFMPVYKRCVDDTQRRILLLEFLIKVSP